VTVLPGLAEELVPGCRTRIAMEVEVPEPATPARLVSILGQSAVETSVLRTDAWRKVAHVIVNGRYITDPDQWPLANDDDVFLMPVYGGG